VAVAGSVDQGFRASPQQRFLWSGFTGSPGTPFIQLTAELVGGVDPGRLDRAVRAVMARHEILRTTFDVPGALTSPVQFIADDAAGLAAVHRLPVPLSDGAAALLDEVRGAELQALDPVRGPGARLVLCLSPAGSALIITASAMVADRRSLRHLLAQIATAYADGPQQQDGPHQQDGPEAAAGIQYADYAAWHNDLLADGGREAQRQFWDARLAERPAQLADVGGWQSPHSAGPWQVARRELGAGLSAAARDVAERHSVGLDAVFAAAWTLLLWRLGGERGSAILAVLDGRTFPELQTAVGPFARGAPVGCSPAAEETFAALLSRVDAELRAMLEPSDDLAPDLLDPQRPGFEYLDDAEPVRAGDITWQPLLEQGHEPAALLLRAGDGPDGLSATISHLPGQLDGAQAARLLDRLMLLLGAALARPDSPVNQLPLCLPEERDRILRQACGPPPVAGAGQTIHGLFAEQAARTPGAVAVECGAGSLTYADLDRQSASFAGCLAGRGARAGDRVVLYLGRQPEFLVAALGVLRLGAAYVPVDPRMPADRVRFLLADTGATVLVTAGSPGLPDGTAADVVRIDGGWLDAAGTVAPPPPPAASAGTAYVMYTSGTTGTPNGVPVSHQALLNYLRWAVDAYDLRSGTGALVHTSVGFDLTVTGLLGPLLAGQRVILVPEPAGLSGLLAELSQRRDLSLLKLTPSQLAALAQLLDERDLAGLIRTLVLGGEELRADVLEPFRRGDPGIRIFNEYGPTETVVGSSAYEVTERLPGTGPVPVGWPIAGTSIHLLDPAGQLVPDGVPGEICIGGAGVGDGYLGRPELSRERFIPDPFGPGPLYRTGDQGTRLPGAGLVYRGRTDAQLKVRGVRVEPGEIEAVLCRHPDIRQAAVALSASQGGGSATALVAYLVLAPGAVSPGAADLARFCGQFLPDYLVPAVFVPLPALPVTPGGKLDRRALPDPGSAGAPATYRPPRTETEEILAAVLGSVLGRERVGIDDNYFAMGGDSIRSVMAASQAQARGVSVSVPDLHRYPTIAELTTALGNRPRQHEPATWPFSLISAADQALLPADAEDAFPLNLLQEGMIFHRSFAAKSAVYHAIASVRLRAPLDRAVMQEVIRQLVRRHPMLRTSFDLASFSRPLEIVHKNFADPLSYQDLRGLPPSEQDQRIADWVAREKERGFELHEHPLIRFMVQPLDEETFQFTYGFHHEIVDGWSEALLVTELFNHYFSIIFDQPVTMAPPSSSMRDAVALELEALGERANYEFWDRYLDGATLMRLPRPWGGPHADKGAREIVRIPVTVPPGLSDGLKRLATAGGVPLKSVLLAAHMMVMCQYQGQLDTVTYTVTNGRPESADGSTAIGLFVNSLAVRLAMTGGSWQELVAATQRSEQESLPFRRLPMAELKRHQGNEPLAETLFFFTDYHIFRALDRWRSYGVEHHATELYGESTFPFCSIFRLNRENSQLEIRIEYDSLQFSADLMDSIAGCYTRVLTAMSEHPGANYHTWPLLSGEEQRRLLAEWNSGEAAARPPFPPVHRLIEDQAAGVPDAVAIESATGPVTYRTLNRRANDIASSLAGLGAGPERTVAILATRDPGTIAGILGVLKTGAAYLPLDPAYPPDRVAAILADAQPVAVLVPHHAAGLSADVPVLVLGPDGRLASDHPRSRTSRPRPAGTSPGSAAYVIYTSGSTGIPKGVVITHHGLASSTAARGSLYRDRPGRFLLLSPLAFDSSVAGLFWTLRTGGTLILPAEGLQLEPGALARYIARQRPTHTLCVPSLLTALLGHGSPELLQSLRTVICAGESCPRELLITLRSAVPGAVLYNEYGPTENTVWSTVWSGDPPAHRTQLPIGQPIPGERAYLLNPHLNLVPAGVTGELYLAGAGLARGYLGRPAQTAESFLPDPFHPAGRAYRTGDLARHTPDGQLEFLGRADGQVKIRGFRVELGEIQGLLDAHPGIQRSVVLARRDAAEGQLVAAYIATVPGAEVTVPQLRQYVADRLPRYMVPAAWVVLDALPLTHTGKVDLAALPAPGVNGPQPAAPPREGTEQLVAAIWEQVLGVGLVGAHDEFFEIGGESLRAMQVVTKVNQVFGIDLPVRTLFDAPVLTDFALAVQAEHDLAGHDASSAASARDATPLR
jgi:nonribosomal peptide synthetase protein BlmX